MGWSGSGFGSALGHLWVYPLLPKDIAFLNGMELAAIGEMEFGLATWILCFAKEDMALLERKKWVRHQ